MKLYIKAFLAKNLGDDLFIKGLVNRYKNHKFYAISNGFKYNTYNNLKVYSNKFIYKIIRKFKLQKHLANMCEATITIGGSLYMEKTENDKHKEFTLGKNKQYILGCNFGPYKTQEYFNNVKNAFKKAEDVCFREKYSYELFKDLKNVRYAPDILFSLDISEVKITNRKRAIISIVSCSYKLDESYTENYESKMIELINFLIQKGYEICLMSFCKREKDEEAIESIVNRCNEELREKIETYYYRGNVEEALDVLGDSSLIVGARFHANILGMVLGKPVIPVIYGDKIKNVLNDMNANLKTIDIRKIEEFEISSIQQEDLEKVINIEKEREQSEKQFKALDEILRRE